MLALTPSGNCMLRTIMHSVCYSGYRVIVVQAACFVNNVMSCPALEIGQAR